MRWVFIAVLATSLTACATKHHGRISPLPESRLFTMTCDEIGSGLAEVEAVERNIELNRRVDLRTLWGYAVDAGIGNRIARRRAIQAAQLRRAQLELARFERGCEASVSQ